jgi:hypothetical protein
MVRGRTTSIGWKVVAWAMTLLFAIAPLEARAAMSAAAASHHDRAASASDHHTTASDEHLSQMEHLHHGDCEQAALNDGGHDHSKPHSGSCCGTFCHTPLVELQTMALIASPLSCVGDTPVFVHISGTVAAGLLRPPKV